jgi:acyl-CoA synthetase (AMP-forming)/AMP-acid ligase II
MTVELQVVRADGSQVNKDDCEVGEIIVRGSTVTPGYWRQPEATAAAIKDGWLHTGDLATIDAEGYVNIVDRMKDMIKTGGENVYSTEVEHVLYEHPGILECAVIGVPDETWGEAVKAVVVAKSGYNLNGDEIIAFVKSKLAHFKSPKSIDLVAFLPKTGSGKICKKDLKEPYWKDLSRRVN